MQRLCTPCKEKKKEIQQQQKIKETKENEQTISNTTINEEGTIYLLQHQKSKQKELENAQFLSEQEKANLE